MIILTNISTNDDNNDYNNKYNSKTVISVMQLLLLKLITV